MFTQLICSNIGNILKKICKKIYLIYSFDIIFQQSKEEKKTLSTRAFKPPEVVSVKPKDQTSPL